ncbi:MAG: Fur family transcriptional regulator [Thermomicrobiales bacterium]
MNARESSQSSISDVDSVIRQLGLRGYRATGPRRDVVAVVLDQERPFTAEQIVTLLPAIGRATVYRTLEILATVGIVQRLLKSGGFPSYVVGQPGHRHHLVCSGCARVIEFSDCPIDELVNELAERTDFTIITHHLEISGLCPACRDLRTRN